MRVPEHFDAPVGGRFLIEQQVGAGATAHVYKAIDLVLQRPVALKLFTQWDPERTDHPAAREAELLRSLDHPGIVKIWEDGILADLGVPFLALEWLAAGSLRDFAARQQPSIRQLVELGARCANALGALHAAGIVHRDLKPENILLRPVRGADGRGPELLVEPVLVDFGVATRGAVGTLSGTPAYMSPEQARGVASLDGRSDLYSLGSTLFELLVGRPPHRGPTAIATLARLATTPAPRASLFRPELPRALDDLLVALLSTDSAERPASAAEVESQLLSCLEENDDPYVFPEEPSSRLGSGSSRLVTTIVATAFAASATRDQALHLLLSQGAEAAGLGSDALVGHLGVQGATGREAQAALELGGQLAGWGAAVGIASGRAELRQRAGNGAAYPVGDVVDRAAALAREAIPAQVLADATTAELGRGRHEFRLRGDGSSVVGAALRTPLGDGRGGAPFVGREAELARVLGAYERTLSSRRSVLVTVSAEPGMGKSRLQREAVARLSALANPPRIVVQRSDPYGRRHALGAASDLLAAMIELPRGASAQQATLAIQETLGPSTLRDGQGEHQLLSRLLANEPLPQSIGPNGARDALWLSMTELAREALRDGPLVFVVEDLQWADPESILWLDHLLGREAEHGALLLACVRPEFWSDYGARFQQRERVRIDLRPLSNQASRSIAAAVLGAAPTDERVAEVVARAGGSPLFAEELARLAAAGRESRAAPTIEAAIQVSLDALSPECRDAVGRLSVLGLTTWDSALTALGLPNAAELMRELAAFEILLEQDNSRFPSAREFVFKHALIRDVAYAALDADNHRELHALAGEWLARMGGDAATVAGHLDAGGRPELACVHWLRAAERALATHALGDALSMAERALAYAEPGPAGFQSARILDEAWSRLDPRAADRETAITALDDFAYDEPSRVVADGARARYDDARGRGGDIDRRLAETLTAAASLGMGEELARCSATLAARAAFAGDFEVAEAEAQRLLELANRELPSARVDAYQTLAVIRQAKGAVSTALEARKSAAGAAREAGLKERESMLTTNLGFALSTIGARQEAREALEKGLLLAEAVGSAGAARHAQMNLLGWSALYGTDRQLDGYLAEARAEADAAATGLWAAPDRSNLGVLFYRGVELLLGSAPARVRALSLLRMAVESYRSLGHRDVLPGALAAWAEGLRLDGSPGEAAEVAGEAAELLEQGAPSLLNEAPVFLTLYKAQLDLGDEGAATLAIQRGLPFLSRRLQGLLGSPYARGFLTDLPYNAELVSAADRQGLLPEAVRGAFARSTN